MHAPAHLVIEVTARDMQQVIFEAHSLLTLDQCDLCSAECPVPSAVRFTQQHVILPVSKAKKLEIS